MFLKSLSMKKLLTNIRSRSLSIKKKKNQLSILSFVFENKKPSEKRAFYLFSAGGAEAAFAADSLKFIFKVLALFNLYIRLLRLMFF